MMQRRRKMDPHFVSAQKWELNYIADKFGLDWTEVLFARKAVGKSRKRVYAMLRSRTKRQREQRS